MLDNHLLFSSLFIIQVEIFQIFYFYLNTDAINLHLSIKEAVKEEFLEIYRNLRKVTSEEMGNNNKSNGKLYSLLQKMYDFLQNKIPNC